MKDIRTYDIYPDFLERKDIPEYESKSVLGLLYRDAKAKASLLKHHESKSQPELFFQKKGLMSHFEKQPPTE